MSRTLSSPTTLKSIIDDYHTESDSSDEEYNHDSDNPPQHNNTKTNDNFSTQQNHFLSPVSTAPEEYDFFPHNHHHHNKNQIYSPDQNSIISELAPLRAHGMRPPRSEQNIYGSTDSDDGSFLRQYRHLDRPVEISRGLFTFLVATALLSMTLAILAISGLSLDLGEEILHVFYGPGFQVGYQELSVQVSREQLRDPMLIEVNEPLLKLTPIDYLSIVLYPNQIENSLETNSNKNDHNIDPFFSQQTTPQGIFLKSNQLTLLQTILNKYMERCDVAFSLSGIAIDVVHNRPFHQPTPIYSHYLSTRQYVSEMETSQEISLGNDNSTFKLQHVEFSQLGKNKNQYNNKNNKNNNNNNNNINLHSLNSKLDGLQSKDLTDLITNLYNLYVSNYNHHMEQYYTIQNELQRLEVQNVDVGIDPKNDIKNNNPFSASSLSNPDKLFNSLQTNELPDSTLTLQQYTTLARSLEFVPLETIQQLLSQITPKNPRKNLRDDQTQKNPPFSPSFFPTPQSNLPQDVQNNVQTAETNIRTFGHNIMVAWDGMPLMSTIIQPFSFCLFKCTDLICTSGQSLLFSFTPVIDQNQPKAQATGENGEKNSNKIDYNVRNDQNDKKFNQVHTHKHIDSKNISPLKSSLNSNNIHESINSGSDISIETMSYYNNNNGSNNHDYFEQIVLSQNNSKNNNTKNVESRFLNKNTLTIDQTSDLCLFLSHIINTIQTIQTYNENTSQSTPIDNTPLHTQSQPSPTRLIPHNTLTNFLTTSILAVPAEIRTLALSQPTTKLLVSSSRDPLVTITDVTGAILVFTCVDSKCFPPVDSDELPKQDVIDAVRTTQVASTAQFSSIDVAISTLGNQLISYNDAITLTPVLLICLTTTACELNKSVVFNSVRASSTARTKLSISGDGNLSITTIGTCVSTPVRQDSFISRYTTPNDSFDIFNGLIQHGFIAPQTGALLINLDLTIDVDIMLEESGKYQSQELNKDSSKGFETMGRKDEKIQLDTSEDIIDLDDDDDHDHHHDNNNINTPPFKAVRSSSDNIPMSAQQTSDVDPQPPAYVFDRKFINYSKIFEKNNLEWIFDDQLHNSNLSLKQLKFAEVYNIFSTFQNCLENPSVSLHTGLPRAVISRNNIVHIHCSRLDCLPGYYTVSLPFISTTYSPAAINVLIDSQNGQTTQSQSNQHSQQFEPQQQPQENQKRIKTQRIFHPSSVGRTLTLKPSIIHGIPVDVTVTTGSLGYPLFAILYQPLIESENGFADVTSDLTLATFICLSYHCGSNVVTPIYQDIQPPEPFVQTQTATQNDQVNQTLSDPAPTPTPALSLLSQKLIGWSYSSSILATAEHVIVHLTSLKSLTNRIQIRTSPYGAASTLLQYEHMGSAIIAECNDAFCSSIGMNPLFLDIPMGGPSQIDRTIWEGNGDSESNVVQAMGGVFNGKKMDKLNNNNNKNKNKKQTNSIVSSLNTLIYNNHYSPILSPKQALSLQSSQKVIPEELDHYRFLSTRSGVQYRPSCLVSPCGDMRISSVDGMPIVVFGSDNPVIIHCSNMLCLPYIIH